MDFWLKIKMFVVYLPRDNIKRGELWDAIFLLQLLSPLATRCYVLRDSKGFLSFGWPFDFFPSFMPAAFHSGKKSKGQPQDKNSLLSLRT